MIFKSLEMAQNKVAKRGESIHWRLVSLRHATSLWRFSSQKFIIPPSSSVHLCLKSSFSPCQTVTVVRFPPKRAEELSEKYT